MIRSIRWLREPARLSRVKCVMAWRIESQLVRGEVDNRTRGRVIGRLWLVGRDEPVELELQGNANRDLAGRHLVFVNPTPRLGVEAAFATRQIGLIGQFTASRKVKVPDIPVDKMGEYYERRKSFSWHWGNSVYFEWFSIANGHVVIESADYQLTITPQSVWEMSAAEEELQQRENGEAVSHFFDQLGFLAGSKEYLITSGDLEKEEEPFADIEEDEEFGAEEPLSEDEADEMISDSDRLTDRLMERLDQAGENADLEAILEEELERRRADAEAKPLNPEEEAEREAWMKELNQAAEEISKDPEFIADLDRRHPLSERGRTLSLRVMTEADRGRWVSDATEGENPVADLVQFVTKAGGKLAGALDGRDWPPLIDECGLCIAWLKRARALLTDAAVAGDFCRGQRLVPSGQLEAILVEILALQTDVDAVIEELRERLARGFD